MATLREITYMVLDELKLNSDDAYYTEEHIQFLANKYRAYILKRKYDKYKGFMPLENKSTICLDLEIDANTKPCIGTTRLKSKHKIPAVLGQTSPQVYTVDYFNGEITYVNRNRMRYVGNNKWLNNIIYCSIGPDNYLYFKSVNPQHLYLKKVKVDAVFSDFSETLELQCDEEKETCDIMDMKFPLEAGLVPHLIEFIVKELKGPSYSPEDETNNAKDDLNKIAATQASANNLKREINRPTRQEQVEEQEE